MPSPHGDIRPGPFSLSFGKLVLDQAPVEMASKPEPAQTR
jgi:hypothetical protein